MLSRTSALNSDSIFNELNGSTFFRLEALLFAEFLAAKKSCVSFCIPVFGGGGT